MPRKPTGDKARSSAERQRAYRERLRAAGLKQTWIPDPDRPSPGPIASPVALGEEEEEEEPRSPRPPSRPRRWAMAVDAVHEAAGDLEELRDEYEYWLDNLPDNQRDGILAEKLDTTIRAVETFLEAITELESVDLPLGFGRD